MDFLLLLLAMLFAPEISAFPQGISRIKRSITCLRVGTTATASWTNQAGQTCTWTGLVGSNFGVNPRNGRGYDCNGRCGAGCEGIVPGTLVASISQNIETQNIYTQDCFTHDICSWFNGAKGGSRDPNCGRAYDAAKDDTMLGYSCGSQNPAFNIDPPANDEPVCVGKEALVDTGMHGFDVGIAVGRK